MPHQHALQLQLTGDYATALVNFERVASMESANGDPALLKRTKAGLAKVCLKTGDIARGVILCRELNDQGLKYECAEILNDDRKYTEAAKLYQESGALQKCAQ